MHTPSSRRGALLRRRRVVLAAALALLALAPYSVGRAHAASAPGQRPSEPPADHASAGAAAASASSQNPPAASAAAAPGSDGTGGAAAPAKEPLRSYATRTPEQVASLHRVAATFDAVLDVYRLALVELVPAARRVYQAGLAPKATGASPVPAPVREVFSRLDRSVPNSVPAEALPAIARGYHSEVIDALDSLALAQRLDAVLPPLQHMLRAMRHLAALGGDIVDLFSRNRPILTRVIDPSTVLDDISDALDALAAAEQHIADLRRRKAPMDEQLQGFLRLEVSLGHALDLISLAREAGVQIGVQLQMRTDSLEKLLDHVHHQMDQLGAVVRRMAQPPPAVSGPLQAVVVPTDDSSTQIHLTWPVVPAAQPGFARAAVLQVTRRLNVAASLERLRASYLCDGKSAAEARRSAHEGLEQLRKEAGGPARLGPLPPGRTSLADTVTEPLLAPPLYSVAAISAFGVVGKGSAAAAVDPPKPIAPAGWVAASVAQIPPDSPRFYYDAGAVTVRWGRSPNDVAPSGRALAQKAGLPVVHRYRILRHIGSGWSRAGSASPGVDHFVDRPSVAELQAGVRYTVVAEDGAGGHARPPKGCSATGLVQIDLRPALRLARLGAASVQHPTTVEQRRLAELADPKALAAARSRFEQRPAVEREQLLSQWWHGVARSQRIAWLRHWPKWMTDAERAAWYKEAPQHLSRRDAALAHAEMWIARQVPALAQAYGRWWSLLDAPSRKAALRRWHARLDAARRAWVDERLRKADAATRRRIERPARILAWWNSRDSYDKRHLQDAWQQLPAAEQHQRIATWYAGLSAPAQRSVRWPDWDQRSAAGQRALLDDGYQHLPSGLWKQALAWLAWHDLRGDARAAAVRANVGVVRRLVAGLEFALRPLDVRLGFHLPTLAAAATGGIVLLLVAGWLVRRRRRVRLDLRRRGGAGGARGSGAPAAATAEPDGGG